jgi:hypothetical protein
MKYVFKFLLISSFIFLTSSMCLAQANSVELRNGSGGLVSSHQNIQEAYNAIPATLTQSYSIEIQISYDGSAEVFPISMTSRTGSSAANTITLRPASGNNNEVISTSLNNNAVIAINAADFIIIDGRPGGTGTTSGLTVSNTLSTGTSTNTINLINGASNCIIRYCTLTNATQTSAGPRIVSFGVSPSDSAGNSYNLVTNCVLDGGRTGVGTNGTAGINNDSNTIRSCEIKNWGFAGVWMQANSNYLTIDSCNIYTTGFNVTNPSGISLAVSAPYTVTIKNNKIYDVKSTSTSTSLTIRAIYTSVAPGANSSLNIYNNFISLVDNFNSAVTVYGIMFTGTNDYTCNVNYNSIKLGGTHTGGGANAVLSAGIIKNATGQLLYNQKNNIIINNRTGGVGTGTHTGSALTGMTGITGVDYNVYFSNAGTNSSMAVWEGVTYTDSTTYRTAALPNEVSTRFRNVTFVSDIDLHLAGASLTDNSLRGIPVPGITTDIDGTVRNALFPSRGADEVGLVNITDPLTGTPSEYKLSQNYPNPFNPVTSINYEIPVSGFVSMKLYDISGKEVAALLNSNLSAGFYTVRFDATNFASGTYFYTLTAGDMKITKKMVLMK